MPKLHIDLPPRVITAIAALAGWTPEIEDYEGNKSPNPISEIDAALEHVIKYLNLKADNYYVDVATEERRKTSKEEEQSKSRAKKTAI